MKPVTRSTAAILALLFLFGLFVLKGPWKGAWPVPAWFSLHPTRVETLTIAQTTTYLGSALLYVAAAKGYLEQEGLDVRFLPRTSGRDAVNAVLAKQADLGTCADMPVILAIADGQPVAIVATIFTANRSYGIVARRDRGIASVEDLKFKHVGVLLHSDSHFVLGTMLARHRILPSEVRIESLLPEEMVAAVTAGKVDAISTWEPGLTTASKALAGNGVEFRTEGRFTFDFNLVGRPDWIRANPEKTQRLLKALLRSKQFVDENPREARAVIAAAMKLDPRVFDTVGPDYHFVVQLNQSLLDTLEDQARWAIRNKLTTQTVMPDFLNAISMDALLAVEPDAVTIVR